MQVTIKNIEAKSLEIRGLLSRGLKFIPGKSVSSIDSIVYGVHRRGEIHPETVLKGQKAVIPGKVCVAPWKQWGYGDRVAA